MIVGIGEEDRTVPRKHHIIRMAESRVASIADSESLLPDQRAVELILPCLLRDRFIESGERIYSNVPPSAFSNPPNDIVAVFSYVDRARVVDQDAERVGKSRREASGIAGVAVALKAGSRHCAYLSGREIDRANGVIQPVSHIQQSVWTERQSRRPSKERSRRIHTAGVQTVSLVPSNLEHGYVRNHAEGSRIGYSSGPIFNLNNVDSGSREQIRLQGKRKQTASLPLYSNFLSVDRGCDVAGEVGPIEIDRRFVFADPYPRRRN